MEFIKKNRVKILVILGLIIIVLFAYFVFTLIFPKNEGDLYGNRLIELENYNIEESVFTELKESLISEEEINDVRINKSGKIINFILEINEGVKIEEAQLFASTILVAFTKEQREYYDLQLFLISEDEGYPKIGYKHHTTLEFVWSNN
jgi:hypothetical protein